MAAREEVTAAFVEHAPKKAMCMVCCGSGRMTFGFRAMGQASEPPKCPAPKCENGWIAR